MRLRRSPGTPRETRGSHQGRYLLASAIVLAFAVAPFAVAAGTGDPVRIGVRNPGGNGAVSATSETQIIASNPTYGTRQSNKGDGGGAIYGCRSVPGAEACIRASNLNSGRAFEFATKGSEGGFISATGPNAKPFSTNATGVATGLNADRVDGLDASDLQPKFATVTGPGVLVRGRGLSAANPVVHVSEGNYNVQFASDISACAFTATVTTVNDGGTASGIALNATTLRIETRTGGGASGTDATPPTDRPFNLIVVC
jgi:hypothetical protein